MALETIDIIIIVGYAIALLGIALYVSREPEGHDKNTEDYFLATSSAENVRASETRNSHIPSFLRPTLSSDPPCVAACAIDRYPRYNNRAKM